MQRYGAQAPGPLQALNCTYGPELVGDGSGAKLVGSKDRGVPNGLRISELQSGGAKLKLLRRGVLGGGLDNATGEAQPGDGPAAQYGEI